MYKKLILDPRCLQPAYDVNNPSIYIEALAAIELAIISPDILESEKAVLEGIKLEIRKNRFLIK
jgi:hypothetical protein